MGARLQFLADDLRERIIEEALNTLADIGITVDDPGLVSLLSDHGAGSPKAGRQVLFPRELVERALGTAPRAFHLYDADGRQTHDFSSGNIHFAPGSSAVHFLDYETGRLRKPTTADYVRYARVVSGLEHVAAQATAFIPADVPQAIADSYRLYLSLLYCAKPVITGMFEIDSFPVMRDLLTAVRGSSGELRDRPLAIFTCCPSSPLQWNPVASRNLVDCARHAIPVEVIAMPLAGFTAPVTLAATLVQHTAEVLSGIVIGQLVHPGCPMLYGTSAAIFDVRSQTTPMGAVESMLLACGANEIGHWLGLPTQAYILLSDAMQLDAQAGLESGVGATLAALSGINSISGPGMLAFQNGYSIEKLVLDNELCGMTLRLARGLEAGASFPVAPLFAELLDKGHLITSRHSREHLRGEHLFPGPVINRAGEAQWQAAGSRSLAARAHEQADRLLGDYQPPALSGEQRSELQARMAAAAPGSPLPALEAA